MTAAGWNLLAAILAIFDAGVATLVFVAFARPDFVTALLVWGVPSRWPEARDLDGRIALIRPLVMRLRWLLIPALAAGSFALGSAVAWARLHVL
ncbi:MAG: hypothetical protein JXB39_07790 [Deltaproteobacteria bacterium]|nr:hypothetical protein [Deltaproteobacteria bacterium]